MTALSNSHTILVRAERVRLAKSSVRNMLAGRENQTGKQKRGEERQAAVGEVASPADPVCPLSTQHCQNMFASSCRF